MKKLIYITLFFNFLLFISCNKVQDTTANILVRDEAKNPISGAIVVLNASPADGSKKAADSALTNINLVSGSDGRVSYNFSSTYKLGQAGAAVIDIFSRKIVGSDTLEGLSHVILEPEKDNEAIVTLVKKVAQN
jgi:hypothetical protein